jgi:hypothetical protein
MLTQPGSNNYAVAVGTNPRHLIHLDVRAPAATDILYSVGTEWVDTVNNAVYFLTSFSASGNTTSANWISSGGGATEVSTINSLSPTAGNINIVGTASQLTVSNTGSTVTLSLPSPITVPGSLTATTILAATTSLQLNGAANTVKINASAPTTSAVGFITLSGSATTTLTSSAITANSIILFSLKTLGTLTSSAITYTTTAGSATITPVGPTDTSTYGYLIIN